MANAKLVKAPVTKLNIKAGVAPKPFAFKASKAPKISADISKFLGPKSKSQSSAEARIKSGNTKTKSSLKNILKTKIKGVVKMAL